MALNIVMFFKYRHDILLSAPIRATLPKIKKNNIFTHFAVLNDYCGSDLLTKRHFGRFKSYMLCLGNVCVQPEFFFPFRGCLVALYRVIRLRFGYRFESCDANGPRNVKSTNLANTRARFSSPISFVGNKKSVLKVPEWGQFRGAIRVTPKCCDSCAQGALGRRYRGEIFVVRNRYVFC